jgi:flagellar protein FliS
MTYGQNAYKKTFVQTASKEQILLLLYQSAIKHTKKAIEGIEEGNFAKKGESISKMQEIIIELSSALDMKKGGKVADDLANLYDYILYSSTKANINLDSKHLHSCLEILETLYDGWKKAVEQLRNKNRGINESNNQTS